MYTIGQVSEMFHLPISTLRYYDKEGFFPNLVRKGNIRYFSDNELEALRVIECLKQSGLEIKDIKQFFHKGNQTAVEWYFKNVMENGDIEEFDGISLIEWSAENKIQSLKEFGCNLHNYNPYQKSDTPQFRKEKISNKTSSVRSKVSNPPFDEPLTFLNANSRLRIRIRVINIVK